MNLNSLNINTVMDNLESSDELVNDGTEEVSGDDGDEEEELGGQDVESDVSDDEDNDEEYDAE